MSTKNDYTDAEWKAISTAAVAASLLITSSDSREVTKKAMAVGMTISNATSKSKVSDLPEIVIALAHTMKGGALIPDLPHLDAGDRAKTTAALISVVEAAVRALQTKSPAEAERYKA